jgi:hypothetical protein
MERDSTGHRDDDDHDVLMGVVGFPGSGPGEHGETEPEEGSMMNQLAGSGALRVILARTDPLTAIRQLAEACQDQCVVSICLDTSDDETVVEFIDGVPFKASVNEDGINITFRPLEQGTLFIINFSSILLLAISRERRPGEVPAEPETFDSAIASLAGQADDLMTAHEISAGGEEAGDGV